MEATLFDIKRFAIHDGPGVRTTVFFKACSLRCSWCHNPEAFEPGIEEVSGDISLDGVKYSRPRKIGYTLSTDEIMGEVLRDTELYKQSGGGVTFSGGEPFMQAGVLIELLKACRDKNIHTALDTCGEVDSDIFLEGCRKADLILFDIKTLDNEKHLRLCGKGNEQILINLQAIIAEQIPTRIRYPLIPGVNDSASDLHSLAELIHGLSGSLPLDILPYHGIARSKYRLLRPGKWQEYPVSDDDQLQAALTFFRNMGIDATLYGGS